MSLTDYQRQRVEAEPRPPAPSLYAIAMAWSEMELDALRSMFPDLAALKIGHDWGEPFCFRCGWVAPTGSAHGYSDKWKPERRLGLAWNGAGGWLEKAHLHDHAHGGSSDVTNLVPMCPLCHEEQPECETADDGVAFVNSPSLYRNLLWIAQGVTNDRGHNRRNPGKSDALRVILRGYAVAGAIYANCHRQQLEAEGDA